MMGRKTTNLELPTDARLDPLLDEALSAHSLGGEPPSGLEDRILHATADAICRKGRLFGWNIRAYIGPTGLAQLRACAAVIVLAAWLGIWIVAAGIAKDTLTWFRADSELTRVAWLVDNAGLVEPIDHDIHVVRVRIDLARTEYGWDLAASTSTDAQGFEGLDTRTAGDGLLF